MKPRNAFRWDEVRDRTFQETKNALTETQVLAYYDPLKQTSLHTDASRLKGLGLVLKQQQADGTQRMIHAGSRYLTEIEKRYAMI